MSHLVNLENLQWMLCQETCSQDTAKEMCARCTSDAFMDESCKERCYVEMIVS